MIEPEEVIAANVAALLEAANTGLAVVSLLAPAADGAEKIAPVSHIGVVADLSSQQIDCERAGMPFTYTLRVAIHVAFADDKAGLRFCMARRTVRRVLNALLGDGCAALSGDGFECDEFLLNPTATALESLGDGEGMNKTYSATITGRYYEPTPTTTED